MLAARGVCIVSPMLAPVLLLAATVHTIHVDVAANRHPISPLIYGGAFASNGRDPAAGYLLHRWGGNATTRYNWQANASNRASDWYFESIREDGVAPGGGVDRFIGTARYLESEPMVTIPMMGWVAKYDGKILPSYSVAKYGPQLKTDPFLPDAGNGIAIDGTRITSNDPNDANQPVDGAFQLGFIESMSQKGVRYLLLDNEPSLWHETHRDVHPNGATMDEVASKSIDMAARIKSVDPNIFVGGPEEWGWPAYFYSGYDQQWGAAHNWSSFPDREAHGGWDYLPWLLDQFRRAEQTHGQRLLDVLTVHFYPQGGETSNDVSREMQLRRNRSTRALWDPNYHDDTWIDFKVMLIPRLKQWVATHYPGTSIGITEYDWGAESHINGWTAQADVLGIFGREGLDLAARWSTAPGANNGTNAAMWMYRPFGDLSVRADAPSPDDLSAFAALRTQDGKLTVMIVHKALDGPATVNLSLANFRAGSLASARQLTAGGFGDLADVPVSGSSITLEVPAQSVTLLVIPPAPAEHPVRRRAVRR
jgi:Glycoside hydrolase family 44